MDLQDVLEANPEPHVGSEPSHPARVMLFLHAFAAGGAEAVLLGVANDLERLGVEVVVVVARAAGPNRRKVSETIPIVDLGAARMATSLPALIREIRRINPTVCLSALTHTNLALLFASHVAGSRAKIVVSERRSFHAEFAESSFLKRLLKQFFVSRLYPKADSIIVVSNALKTEMETLFPAAAEQTVVLANPIDTQRLLELARDPTAFSVEEDGVPVIAFLGRLSPQKNLPLLLRAFSDLRQRRRARLVIAGDGPLREEMEALAASLSISADVNFVGYLNNPYRFIDKADVLALSSDFEGLPNVLIEALALGTQIVSTDCPTGPSEILRNGEYGRLVPCGDQELFSRALEDAIDSPLKYDKGQALAPYEQATALSNYRDILLSNGHKG